MSEVLNVFEGLKTLALDLRRSSSSLAHELWGYVNPELWDMTRNQWLVLQTLSKERLEELSNDPKLCDLLRRRLQMRTDDLNKVPWFTTLHGSESLTQVAYFSMEFGLSEALPIYSGGLGMLAGDHLKAASDLGVPLTAIGLLYGQGYFRQLVDANGNQVEYFPYNEPSQLPITPVCGGDGLPLSLPFELPGRRLFVRVWQVQVGRIRLYLLDTNDLINDPRDRVITSELYGGGSPTRLQQEMLLGIGGWRLLERLGIEPEVCHLNEGHAAFVVLERARVTMHAQKCSFNQALTLTRAGNLFTTHTPVAAGFDRFDRSLVAEHLKGYAEELGIGVDGLMALGRANPRDEKEPLNMAYLAIRGAGAVNGVSALHGEVSRQLFAPLFPRWPVSELPVGSVTNGVHIPSWESPEADALWADACGPARWLGTLDTIEEKLRALPDNKLWEFRCTGRRKLVKYVRHRTHSSTLKEEVLTIGFARRFATYKRPDLLLRDPDRLSHILSNVNRPVQLVLAGKAHPADQPGKDLIRRWHEFIRRPEVQGKVVFLPDYDIFLAERLVQGVDVWLNTPRRPYEASGTSGMKVLVNGGLNLSELDGWWAEAYDAQVGWSLGDRHQHDGDPSWDAQEAEALYRLLEEEVIPAFYTRDGDGVPTQWLLRMRESMAHLTPVYSTNRMVRQYVEEYYLILAKRHRDRVTTGAGSLLAWQQKVREHFGSVRFGVVHAERSGNSTLIQVEVLLGDLDPAAVRVELYANSGAGQETHIPMTHGSRRGVSYVFRALVPAEHDPSTFTPRVIPFHPDALIPLEMTQILWQH